MCTELHGVVRTTMVAMEENDGAVPEGDSKKQVSFQARTEAGISKQ